MTVDNIAVCIDRCHSPPQHIQKNGQGVGASFLFNATLRVFAMLSYKRHTWDYVGRMAMRSRVGQPYFQFITNERIYDALN